MEAVDGFQHRRRADKPNQQEPALTGRHYKPEEIVKRLHQVGILVGQGCLVTEAIREIGVTSATYYRWRANHYGSKADSYQKSDTNKRTRLEQLEMENIRLRWAIADLTLEKQKLRT